MKKTEEKLNKYSCEKCCFNTQDKNDYKRHLLTSKHKISTLSTKVSTNKTETNCVCGKKYKDRTGLWYHKKKCIVYTNVDKTNACKHISTYYNENQQINQPQFILSNQENSIETLINDKTKDEMIINLQQQLIEALNKPTTVNNNNTQNNQFNLQLYLNETCSNAINIDTLLKNIKVTIENVIEIGEIGYSKGIGNLIAKHIKGMNQLEKPIQTTDVKRGLSWIKNKNNEWIKDEDLTLANNFIFLVGDKYFREYADGITTIKEWKDTQSKIHDKVVESISQITKVIISDDKSKDYSKIHKTIAENTMVKK